MKKGALYRSAGVLFSIGRREPTRDNVKNLLDAVIDEGKFYFESVLFDIAKKIAALEEMLVLWKWGRMCVMVIRKKRLEFFITLYQGFLGFGACFRVITEMELLFEIKIIYS